MAFLEADGSAPGDVLACPTGEPAVKLTNLLYHDVVQPGAWSSSGFEGGAADSYKIEAPVFERHLRLIAEVEPRPAVAVQSALSEGSDAWTFTVDDGGVSAATEIAPALEARGWVGHFFVTTGMIGEPGFVTEEQIRALASRGHVIGSHTVSHPARMAKVPFREAVREWTRSRERLERILGTSMVVASVPGGHYDRNVARAAAEAGIRILFNSEPERDIAGVEDCRVVGRFCVKRGTPDDEVLGLVTGEGAHRLRHWTMWNAKKLAKRIAGPAYLGAQKLFHSNR